MDGELPFEPGPPAAEPASFGAPGGLPPEEDCNALLERAYQPAKNLARSLLPAEEAEDLVHDTAARWLAKWPTLTPPKRRIAYFMASVRNGALDRRRSNNRVAAKEVPLDPSIPAWWRLPTPKEREEDARFVEAEQILSAFIRKLPDRQREVWCWLRLSGWSTAWVAMLLGISVRSVENHVYRADKALYGALAKAGFPFGREGYRALLAHAQRRIDGTAPYPDPRVPSEPVDPW